MNGIARPINKLKGLAGVGHRARLGSAKKIRACGNGLDSSLADLGEQPWVEIILLIELTAQLAADRYKSIAINGQFLKGEGF